jgi:hypothetical protein
MRAERVAVKSASCTPMCCEQLGHVNPIAELHRRGLLEGVAYDRIGRGLDSLWV